MRTAEPRIFRATSEAWIGQFMLPMIFFVILTCTAIHLAGLSPWIAVIGLCVLALVASFDYVLPMARNWVRLDDRIIEGSINGQPFLVYWTEVLAAWQSERGRSASIFLGTRGGTLVLPTRFLDGSAVWSAIQSAVSPDALKPEAVKKLPDAQGWVDEFERMLLEGLVDENPRAVTDHWLIQVAGWAGITFFGIGLVGAFEQGDLLRCLLYLLPIALCAGLLSNWGFTEFNNQAVERYTLFGGWSIAWEDVRWVETDPFNLVIVLVGQQGRVVISGVRLWGGGATRSALGLLLAHTRSRGIPVRNSLLALFKTPRYYRIVKRK